MANLCGLLLHHDWIRMLTATDFIWNEFFWKTSLDVGRARLAPGPVDFVFAPEGRGEGPLTDGELRVLNLAASSIGATLDTAIAGLFETYSALQEAYGYSGQDRASWMPDLSSGEGLYDLVALVSVNVHCLVRDEVPYVGVELNCRWDPEHGAGLLIHGSRVVEVGGADTAILLWIAERDAGGSRAANNP